VLEVMVFSYVVSGCSRTVAVRLKADATYACETVSV